MCLPPTTVWVYVVCLFVCCVVYGEKVRARPQLQMNLMNLVLFYAGLLSIKPI